MKENQQLTQVLVHYEEKCTFYFLKRVLKRLLKMMKYTQVFKITFIISCTHSKKKCV